MVKILMIVTDVMMVFLDLMVNVLVNLINNLLKHLLDADKNAIETIT